MTTISIHIIKVNGHAAPGKRADAKIHFAGGELDGLKLVGFAVWKSRDGKGQNVSCPSRHFMVDGDRRTFLFVRWVDAPDALRRLELGAVEQTRTDDPELPLEILGHCSLPI